MMDNRRIWRQYVRAIRESGSNRADTPKVGEDGIRWARVGGNASHEFYLGIGRDGRLWKKSCGEAWDDRLFEADGRPEGPRATDFGAPGDSVSEEFWDWVCTDRAQDLRDADDAFKRRYLRYSEQVSEVIDGDIGYCGHF